MQKSTVSFELNGLGVDAETDHRRSLLDILRNEFALNGPKYGCGMAQCGACTVLVDGKPARACVLRAARVAGRQVTTLEGLASEHGLHPVQKAFVEKQAAQCGYCLNGMVMSAVSLLAHNPSPSPDEIRTAMRDNLCRCGTHQEILEAIVHAAQLMQEKGAGHV